MEYREIFLTLLRKFDETKQPRTFLRDLVESTHLFLRMLERFCKGRNNLVVQVSLTLYSQTDRGRYRGERNKCKVIFCQIVKLLNFLSSNIFLKTDYC